MQKMKLLSIQSLLLAEIAKLKNIDPEIALRMIRLMQMLDRELNLEEV